MRLVLPALLGLLLALAARPAAASPIVLEDLACMFENGRAIGRILHSFEYGGTAEAEALTALHSEVDAMALCFSPQPALDSSWVTLDSFWEDELYLPPFAEDDAVERLQLRGSALSSEKTTTAIVSFWSAGVLLGSAEVICGLESAAFEEGEQLSQFVYSLELAASELEIGMGVSPGLLLLEPARESLLSIAAKINSYEDPAFVTVADYETYIQELSAAISSGLSAFQRLEAVHPRHFGAELLSYYPGGELELEKYSDPNGRFRISLPAGGESVNAESNEWEGSSSPGDVLVWHARWEDPVTVFNLGLIPLGEELDSRTQGQVINGLLNKLRQDAAVTSADLRSTRVELGGIDYYPVEVHFVIPGDTGLEEDELESSSLMFVGFSGSEMILANFVTYSLVDRRVSEFAAALLSTLEISAPTEPAANP